MLHECINFILVVGEALRDHLFLSRKRGRSIENLSLLLKRSVAANLLLSVQFQNPDLPEAVELGSVVSISHKARRENQLVLFDVFDVNFALEAFLESAAAHSFIL